MERPFLEVSKNRLDEYSFTSSCVGLRIGVLLKCCHLKISTDSVNNGLAQITFKGSKHEIHSKILAEIIFENSIVKGNHE